MSEETDVADERRLRLLPGDGQDEPEPGAPDEPPGPAGPSLAARLQQLAAAATLRAASATSAAAAPHLARLAAWPARIPFARRLAAATLPVIPIWWAWQPFVLVAVFAALGFLLVGLRNRAPLGPWATAVTGSAGVAAVMFHARGGSWVGGLVALGQGLLAGWLLLVPTMTQQPRPPAGPGRLETLTARLTAPAQAASEASGPTGDADGQAAVEDPVAAEAALPPAELLTHSDPDAEQLEQPPSGEVDDRGQQLQEMFTELEVDATVIGQVVGPTITRYEVTKAPNTKVGRIRGLAEDIAYTLAAPGGKVDVALIPGRSAIGIDVGNHKRRTVWLGDLIDTIPRGAHPLTVPLGHDLAGDHVHVNLAELPHVIVAGTTGSGKSVCLNCLVTSLLIRNSPDQVRLLLIDPKRVELTSYDGVPHLVSPVVTDPTVAAAALAAMVEEMERRTVELAMAGVRHIAAYNAKHTANPLPYIVVVIDELADLMMIAPREVEAAICRIAQMARAVGIHLVAATQRPSVDVVTGVIKANIPARLAFMTATDTDARTIIDAGGADKLLGHGDALYLPPGTSIPQRVQGAWTPDTEIARVQQHWRDQVAAGLNVPPALVIQQPQPVDEPATTPGPAAAAGRRDTAPLAQELSQKALADAALAAIRSWADRNEDLIVVGPIKGDLIGEGKVGQRRNDGTLVLLPDPVRAELVDLGMDPDEVLRAWIGQAMIPRGEGGNLLPKVWLGPIAKTRYRCIMFPAPA